MALFLTCFRTAIRGFLRTPGFTAAVLLTLALGLGANLAVFSLTQGTLFRPLPYPQAERLVALRSLPPAGFLGAKQVQMGPVSAPNVFDWRDQARRFDGMALYGRTSLDLAEEGTAEHVKGLRVSAGFFELLGAPVILGRTFTREDEGPEQAQVAVLGHGLWLRRYAGSPSILGRTVVLGGRSRTIIGVLSPAFVSPEAGWQEVFLPFHHDPAGKNRTSYSYQALGRLKPGIGLAQGAAEIRSLTEGIHQQYPETQGWSATATDLHRLLVGDRARSLLLLQGAVLLLLMIACANVANLLLARSLARQRDQAIRVTLGAGRRQLFVQHLVEGLLLGGSGGLLGALLAQSAIRVLPQFFRGTSLLPPVQAPEWGPAVLGCALVLSLLASLVFAGVPTWMAARADLRPQVQREALGTPGARRLRSLLVGGQVALATVLLMGAGLLLRSFVTLLRTSPGFDARQVLTFEVNLPIVRYKTDAQQRAFTEALVARLSALPGVEGAASAWTTPIGGVSLTSFSLGPSFQTRDHSAPILQVAGASPGYLHALNIPLRQGRDFDRTGVRPEAIVNEAFVRTHVPDGQALGKHLRAGVSGDAAPAGTAFEIVGVMGDQRNESLEQAPRPAALFSDRVVPSYVSAYLVRTSRSLGDVAPVLRAQVAALDGQVAVRDLNRLEDLVDAKLGDRRHALRLLGGSAGLALLLAALGIHGVISFQVEGRTREIGLRMALGATVAGILRMVCGQGMKPVLVGAAAGLVAFSGLSRFLASQLYGTRPTDPWILLLVLALLSQVALLACLLPALRAARIAPAEALRSE